MKKMLCITCERPFTPRELPNGVLAKVCPQCAIIALATLMESTGPGDTIREIHEGEQLGAELRKIAGQ